MGEGVGEEQGVYEGRGYLVSEDESVDDVNHLFVRAWKVRAHLTDQPLLT